MNYRKPKLLQCNYPHGHLSAAQKVWSKKVLCIDLSSCLRAGAMGPISLDQEVTEMVTGAPVPNALPSAFPHPIAFNLIPHVDQFREDGYTKEELKMGNESRKILSLPRFKGLLHLCKGPRLSGSFDFNQCRIRK